MALPFFLAGIASVSAGGHFILRKSQRQDTFFLSSAYCFFAVFFSHLTAVGDKQVIFRLVLGKYRYPVA